MLYLDLFNQLKSTVNYNDDQIALPGGLVLRNFSFTSRTRFEAPGLDSGEDLALPNLTPEEDPDGAAQQLGRVDADFAENLNFRYHLIMPAGQNKARNIIFMFHGFNEKYWDKYLPWATHIAAKTGKSVLMFPLAFHMNRAPAIWSDTRPMHRISKARKQRYPDIIHSSLSNVAISARLHNKPDRFIWSGLESYHDVIDLVEAIKKGQHPAIEAEAGIDFCSYSIGTFLGEIIMMTNKKGYFSQSRYATFCGGPVFNRLSPVSKFILDSEANVRLYSYLVEHLESHMKNNAQLGKLLGGDYEEGTNFRSLLNYRAYLPYREDKIRAMSDRFYAIALAQDEVVPPYEVMNTLQGSRMDIPTQVEVLDFPYPYRHEDPFPAVGKTGENNKSATGNPDELSLAVDAQFRKVFDRISEFLS